MSLSAFFFLQAGIAIKPATPVELLYEFEELVDCFLIMTVEPGFGGQKFMHSMMEKVRALRKRCPTVDIGVSAVSFIHVYLLKRTLKGVGTYGLVY